MMERITLESVLVLARRICLLLAICLGMCATGAGSLPEIAKAGYAVPKWIGISRSERGVDLPPAQHPFEYSFAVSPGVMMRLGGAISQASAKRRNDKSAIFLINFYDADHREVETKALPYNQWLKGYFSRLAGSVRPVPFYFEIKVPKGAVEAKIRFARLNPQVDDVRLSSFSHGTAPADQALWNMAVVYCLFAFAFALAWMSYKTGKNREFPDGAACPVEGRMAKACKIGVLVLTAVMACVFVREAYVTIGRNSDFLPLSGILGSVMALIVFGTFVCSIAKDRDWLSIALIMAICLVAHVAVIRLTHSLYQQRMFSDFGAVERVMKSSTVAIGHLDIPYWANYEFLCSVLGKLFSRDIQVAQYLNALCCTAAVFPVFKLSYRAGGRRIAVFTSLLMALSPITLLYGTLLTGEFVSAAAFAWTVYFIVRMLEEPSLRQKCTFALWAGICAGLGNLTKPLAKIFIAATVVVIVFDCMKNRWKYGVKWLAVLFALVGSCLFTSNGAKHVIQEVVKPQAVVDSEGNILVGTLLIGLNAEKHGRNDLRWIGQWRYWPIEKRLPLLKHIIRRDYKKYPALFIEKLDRAYSDPSFGWVWYDHSIRVDVPWWVKSSVCIWNLVVLVLIGAGVLGFAVSGRVGEKQGFAGMVATLVVAAFTTTLLLAEAQPRYKTAIYPVFFLLIPYARFLFEKDGPLCNWLGRGMSIARGVGRRLAKTSFRER